MFDEDAFAEREDANTSSDTYNSGEAPLLVWSGIWWEWHCTFDSSQWNGGGVWPYLLQYAAAILQQIVITYYTYHKYHTL
jgi:hypothetical protein